MPANIYLYMITFFPTPDGSSVYAVVHNNPFSQEDLDKLAWLFNGAKPAKEESITGVFTGPRSEMITPWSTNAVEITQNMNVGGEITRIEALTPSRGTAIDPMLQHSYTNPGQDMFAPAAQPEPIRFVEDLDAYNKQEGLAMSRHEIDYLHGVEQRLGRKLTDSEVFGFAEVNSEHCRHKIFNGTFIIDGKEQKQSLFKLIKATSKENPNGIVSAYKDNVAFVQGPLSERFAPTQPDTASYFAEETRPLVLSIKAETHNFPTTVEPFNGAATGTGGEIRDRMSGGKASVPVAGTAVYMSSYHRLDGPSPKEAELPARPWLYQTPQEILTKASNGASDFGNKFGQPLINGSLLTFEHTEGANSTRYGYDKVIMLAGGIGYAPAEDAQKEPARPGEEIVVLGGDNYRIGMGGGAVSSVATGQYGTGIELNAVQRANPEMQKRVQNVVRALSECAHNPIVSIHDHGAGGHLNSLTELIEETGGNIDIDALPVGDPSLSAKEIIANESQERMGLLVRPQDYPFIERIAKRECAPIYKVGTATDDHHLLFAGKKNGVAIDLDVSDFLGSTPKTVMEDRTIDASFRKTKYDPTQNDRYIDAVLKLDAVACKDFLTNKVDRSVSGLVAGQQCVGPLQLPLADAGVIALDFTGTVGMATALGHAPQAALIDPAAGSVLAIAEALTNIVLVPLEKGLASVSLSANWMWPCKQPGQDAGLYKAVKACSDFAIELGINIPTGKDSLSMTQKYPDGSQVLSPGTVIITAAAPVSDVKKTVTPVLQPEGDIIYIDFSLCLHRLGGSALAQSLGFVGEICPNIADATYFADAFNAVQSLLNEGLILAGHDISAGGLATTLLEMCFANTEGGMEIRLDDVNDEDLTIALFAENPGLVLQVSDLTRVTRLLERAGVAFAHIGRAVPGRCLTISKDKERLVWDIDAKRKLWYKNSYLLERFQTTPQCAQERYTNYEQQPVRFAIPTAFEGTKKGLDLRTEPNKRSGITAAILRDKGTNGEREMAYALYLAGFDVKDVHVTDLISGREDLKEVQMLVFCGGFSHSDVLGSAKGWAGGILYNPKAKQAFDEFYARPDTLSLGICNGCQLMAELGLLYPDHQEKHKLVHNLSGKFESAFLSLHIPQNNSVMLSTLAGCDLGIWVAHGEGRFDLPYSADKYCVAARYAYEAYPGNPNGSPEAIAALCSADGRHLAMMPHPERAVFPWQCATYPTDRRTDEVTPWMQAFRNAFLWCREHKA